MRQSNRILSLVLAVLFALTLFPLSASAAVKIAPPKQTMYVDLGGTAQLVLTVSGAKKGVTLPITYVSNNPGIATIDASGIITGIAKGSTTVTATYDKQTLAIPVYVCEAFQPYTYGKTFQISYPKSWESDNQLTDHCKGMFSSSFTTPNDAYRENVIIMAYPHRFKDASKFVADYLSWCSANIADFELVYQGKTKVAGTNAVQIISTHTGDYFVYKVLIDFVVTNQYDYMLTYNAEAANYDAFAIEGMRIINSFRLLK